MSNGDDDRGVQEEFNRLIDGFSTLIDRQQADLESGMRSIADALNRAAERLSSTVASASARTPIPVPSVPASGSTPAGILLVRVVNDSSQPVPVQVTQQDERGGGGIGNFFGGFLGGIGSLAGNLIGGIVGGFTSPFTAIIQTAELIGLTSEITNLVGEIRRLSRDLVVSLAFLLRDFFQRMNDAGVFPVSRLIASLLLLIDRGITLILMHITPYLTWVTQLVQALVTWVGELSNALSRWLSSAVNRLVLFLSQVITYLYETTVRKITNLIRDITIAVTNAFREGVSALVGALAGFLTAFGNVIALGAEWIAYAITRVLNQLPGINIPVSAPSGSFGGAISRGFREGRATGRAVSEGLFGPLPPVITPGPPLERPRFRMPGFDTPELTLPESPTPSPMLERLIGGTGAVSTETGAVTLNGDINVSINAAAVDGEHADDVARQIASQVLEEIRRLTEVERFSRGLPTRGTSSS